MFAIEFSQTQYQGEKKLVEVTGIIPNISFETEEDANEWIFEFVRSRRDTLMLGVKGAVYAADRFIEFELGPGLTVCELVTWVEL